MHGSQAINRALAFLALVGAIIAFFALGLNHYLSLASLREHEVAIRSLVEGHPVLSMVAFVGAYMALVALSLPGGAIMTMSGGFLFGLWLGALLSIVGATAGALIVFRLARFISGDLIRSRLGPFLARMLEGLERNAFSHLLFLRLVPLFPFWAVNLAPALLGMSWRPYVAATAIGIIPGALAYASIGDGLGQLFQAGGGVSVEAAGGPTMIGLRIGLACLAVLPIALKWLRKRR